MATTPALDHPAADTPSFPDAASGPLPSSNVTGCGGTCAACNTRAPKSVRAFVYGVGRIHPRIPDLGLEKEIAQSVAHGGREAATDEESLIALLGEPRFEFIARQVCWVFSVEGIDSYVLQAPDSATLRWIVESLRPDKGPRDVDVVIGRIGPMVSPSVCNGATLPSLEPIQVYSFDRATLAKNIEKPKDIDDKTFAAAVKQTLDVTARVAGNFGTSDGHRALNYLVTRYAHLYEVVARQLVEGAPLTSLHAQVSPLSGARRVVDVILGFRERRTDIARNFSVRVDVTDAFPFLVSPAAPYFAMSS